MTTLENELAARKGPPGLKPPAWALRLMADRDVGAPPFASAAREAKTAEAVRLTPAEAEAAAFARAEAQVKAEVSVMDELAGAALTLEPADIAEQLQVQSNVITPQPVLTNAGAETDLLISFASPFSASPPTHPSTVGAVPSKSTELENELAARKSPRTPRRACYSPGGQHRGHQPRKVHARPTRVGY